MAAVPTTMKAWQYEKYGGGASSLEQVEIPVPKPGPNQVLLKIHASSVNPVDWKLQTGFAKYFIPLKLPVVPGVDMAGTIVGVGSGITDFKVGDRVLATTDIRVQGALAEYAAIDTKAIAKLAPELSFEEAAALPVAGMTPLQGLTKAGFWPKANGRVLVQAASGGVGHYAVQLAKLAGAHVTATAGTRNLDLIKSLGADEVIDYKNVADPSNPYQSPSKERYDVILHCGSKEEPWAHWRKVLAKKGKVITFTPAGASFVRSYIQAFTFQGQRIIPHIAVGASNDLQTLADLAAAKKLKTVVDSTYSFGNVEKAWEKSLDGHATGKIVVAHV